MSNAAFQILEGQTCLETTQKQRSIKSIDGHYTIILASVLSWPSFNLMISAHGHTTRPPKISFPTSTRHNVETNQNIGGEDRLFQHLVTVGL